MINELLGVDGYVVDEGRRTISGGNHSMGGNELLGVLLYRQRAAGADSLASCGYQQTVSELVLFLNGTTLSHKKYKLMI